MFSKNNLKYITIIALGFFWCSSVYLTQEQYLAQFASDDFVNTVELLFGSLSMALGILTFGLIYKKDKNMKSMYLHFNLLAIASIVIFFVTKNINIMSVCLCTTCYFGTAGFGAGYHFSLLGSNVIKEYRGRVFAIGYGLGSIGTYILILFPESFYASSQTLTLYIPIILLTTYLVLKKVNLEELKEENYTKSFKLLFLRISIIILAMSLLSALSTDAISLYTINVSGGYGSTRIYYCLGLLIAGYLADKKNNIFEVLTIVSFIYALLAIILLKDGYSINLIASLSYFFVGFFVLFRTVSFLNLVDNKKNILWASAFGLMYSRIMEGILVLFENSLLKNYTTLIIVIVFALSLVIILYFFLYFQNNKLTSNDTIKNLTLKYNLSVQEEKVLKLLIEDYTREEIADKLYLSVNTIRNHVANIYKKTNMKKRELKEICLYRTN